jgi:hypothetical protein
MADSKKYQLFVDNEKYLWDESTITGAQLRVLAGIPDSAQVFQKIPGKPDLEITNTTVVDLTKHDQTKFSTQSTGSQAG